ncbi:UDP-N-acetylmuramoyl-L-alanyl-D-glutamate--2,6-diaminopimelate ligase [bacterium]|nr:MAG: UDP-N-acetylmuramoyl-L-alanyl-D-glutamate--2,6-diaminopimelate ligase [bacterium]
MTLSALLREAGVAAPSRGEAEVVSATSDSRRAKPGALFFVYPGGERFLPAAKQAGVVAAIVSTEAALAEAQRLGLAVAMMEPRVYARVAHAFYGFPTRQMRVLAVTGTNGKTTVAWLVRDMVQALGRKAAYLGTLGFGIGDELRPLANTTPFGVELAELLAEARDAGCELVAMEISSHALEEGRAEGVEVDVAVFTNLTQDHLDYHGTMETYAAAKKRLFTGLPRGSVAVLNLDDPTGRAWAAGLKVPIVGYRIGGPRGSGGEGIRAEVHKVGLESIEMTLEDGTWMEIVDVPLGGSYNVSNALAAFSGVLALHFERWLGADFEASEAAFLDCAQALEKVKPVRGRFETLPNEKGIGAIVDYAHTPDAIEKLLEAVRPLTEGRIITVFGCGGDRDRTKRPLMAKAASERSDLTVITSDNPRTEDPEAIIREIAVGAVGEHVEIVDRAEAIAYAVKEAHAGDVVVVAGKGHEDYQIIGKEKTHLDDRDLLREALR